MKNIKITESERRKAARLRKSLAAQRTPKARQSADSFSVRLGPTPLQPAEAEAERYEWLLIPDRDLKHSEGRYPSREVESRLRNALAVQTLITYCNLLEILGTRTAVELGLQKAVPLSLKTLLGEGRKRLTIDTAFESEEEVHSQSRTRYANLKKAGMAVSGSLRSERVKAELAAPRLLGIAYDRARRVFSASEDAQRRAIRRSGKAVPNGQVVLIDDHSWRQIEDSFGKSHHELSVRDLWQIAFHADVNPTSLWPRYIRGFSQLFEIARFIGRIDRGLPSRLEPDHLALLEAILTGRFGPHGDYRDQLAAAVSEKLGEHFGRDSLLGIVHEAREQAGALEAAGARPDHGR